MAETSSPTRNLSSNAEEKKTDLGVRVTKKSMHVGGKKTVEAGERIRPQPACKNYFSGKGTRAEDKCGACLVDEAKSSTKCRKGKLRKPRARNCGRGTALWSKRRKIRRSKRGGVRLGPRVDGTGCNKRAVLHQKDKRVVVKARKRFKITSWVSSCKRSLTSKSGGSRDLCILGLGVLCNKTGRPLKKLRFALTKRSALG